MAQQPSRLALPRPKQPRFKVATDENAGTRPRLVNMTAKSTSSFLDRKKSTTTVGLNKVPVPVQRSALGEIHNVRKKELLKDKENVPSSKVSAAKDATGAGAPVGLKRRRSPSLHAATARPARIPNPPPAAAVTTVSVTTTTTTVRTNNNENRNSVHLATSNSTAKAPVENPQPQRRLGRMLQAINTRRQSQVFPARTAAAAAAAPTVPVNSIHRHPNVPFPSTEAPSSVLPASREIPSSVLPSSRPPSPVPASETPQDEDEDEEANLATETDDSTVVIETRKRTVSTVSETKSIVRVEKEETVARDPIKTFEDMKDGDWLYAPPDKRAEFKAYVDRVAADFIDEPELEDATMVAEYADEIFQYMSKLEEESMPMPDYMNGQQEIDWQMRATLIDWLLQVHLRYHMLPETLWIAINIIDRFLSRRVVSVVKLQLVGVTAMFIAAKYEEIIAPSVEEYVKMTEGGYKKEEILKGEKIVLQTIDFRISSYCSPYSWVRRISKADDYNLQTRTLCKFLIELTLLDWRFLRAKPSMIAAIGMYSARRMLGQDWNDAFVFYSGKVEEELVMGYEFILETLAQSDFDKQYIYKKYMSKRFLKASTYAREWALQNCIPPSSVRRNVLNVGEEVAEKRPRTDSQRSSIYSLAGVYNVE